MKLILGSTSPRRKEILNKLNFIYEIISPSYDEKLDEFGNPYIETMNAALNKALSITNTIQLEDDQVVLTADTIVYKDRIIGKPKDENDALDVLKFLSGKTHLVITGIAMVSNSKKIVDYSVSTIKFKKLNEIDILEYINTKSPLDKAGSYAIQEVESSFIEYFNGEYDNIVGLPSQKLMYLIDKHFL
jgi:septum formation protein